MRTRRKAHPLVAVAGCVMVIVGCSPDGTRQQAGMSSGAPPWVVCGQTVIASAAGPIVLDATGAGTARSVGNLTVGGIDLRVTQNCQQGATVTFTPAAAATVQRGVHTADGRWAAVAILPNQPRFTITIAHADGSVRTIPVALVGDLTHDRRFAELH